MAALDLPPCVAASKRMVWSDEMLRLLDKVCAEPLETSTHAITPLLRKELPLLVRVLRYTGLRPSTVMATRLEWIDLKARCIHYTGKYVKNGEDYDCPLDEFALPVIAELKRLRENAGREKLFDCSYRSLVGHFLYSVRPAMAREAPEAKGLLLYGLRHTWTTENAPLFPLLSDFLAYSGRKHIGVAMRYYNPAAGKQAEMLDKRRAEAAKPKDQPDPALAQLAQQLAALQQQNTQLMQMLLAQQGVPPAAPAPAPTAQVLPFPPKTGAA